MDKKERGKKRKIKIKKLLDSFIENFVRDFL